MTMDDGKGTTGAIEILTPVQAVEAELARIAQATQEVESYRRDTLRVFAQRVVTTAIPGMTRERWEHLVRGQLADNCCQHDGCEENGCLGDCEPCDDHHCEQCWRDRGHYADSCCGWCGECADHVTDDRDDVCEKGYCHDCGHYCA